ncbi:MAG: sulfatase [Bryobacteraceae bacterium]|nr:sulfatase [Bryobacteraceae bacterium]
MRDWSRRQLLRAAALGAGVGRSQPAPGQNIIFLLTDDQRWDSLGCMGNPIVKTPHIDEMAASGVTFTNHFVTTSICMTSRASIFTGLYARTHRINDFETAFTERQYAAIYPAALRQAGYRTGFIGKWGVGNQMPARRFDFFQGFPGQGHYFPRRPDTSVHLTALMGDQAIEFLAGCSPKQPFCLSISFKAPHIQDEDPRQFLHSEATAGLYKDVEIPLPKTADPRYISLLPLEIQRSEARRRWAIEFGTPALYRQSVKGYYRLITEVDTVVGRIREQLRRIKADDNTVVVFTSDNGFYLGEHGLSGKWFMHEESIRAPLVIYDPRLPRSLQGQRRTPMSLNIDLAPTILGYAGIGGIPMQGRNLRPVIEGRTAPWRLDWFYEHNFSHAWIPRSEGVRTETWKYARYLDTEPLFEELYDLAADPLEERNLVGDPAFRAKADELRGRWRQWRDDLDAWPGGA